MSDDQKKPNVILKGEEGLVLNHNYDGIQELDHPLPMWWLAIFYVTIAFAFVYCAYEWMGMSVGSYEALNMELKTIESLTPKSADGEKTNAALMAELRSHPEWTDSARTLYQGRCAVCHAADGGGGIGPNLTDDHWIHGAGAPVDMAVVIEKGVAEKGMPPWGALLKREEIVGLVGLIRSLHGSKPAKPKDPQGEVHPFQTEYN